MQYVIHERHNKSKIYFQLQSTLPLLSDEPNPIGI